MKELRPGSSGSREIRILFVFDPKRKAIMLVGGDKQRKWDKWYRKAIPEAERRYLVWLGGAGTERRRTDQLQHRRGSMADSRASPASARSEAEKRRMPEEIRALTKARGGPQGRRRHPEAIGAGPGGQPEEDKRHRVGRRGPYQGGHAETLSRRHRRNIARHRLPARRQGAAARAGRPASGVIPGWSARDGRS